jgi:hypothetical protein
VRSDFGIVQTYHWPSYLNSEVIFGRYIIGSGHCYFWMIYYWWLNIYYLNENIIEKNTLVCQKHRSKGIRDNSHQNPILLKLKLGCQANSITNSTNSEAELLCDKVDKVELSFMK